MNAEHGITGRETVRFTNRTRFSFEDLRLHLYLNAWKNDRSTWLTEQARGGGRSDRGVRAAEAAAGASPRSTESPSKTVPT